MTPEEKDKIQAAFDGRAGRIRLGLRLTDDFRGKQFQAFADELQSLAPDIVVQKEDHQDTLPGLKITDHVIYHAIPRGRELSPFLDFLAGDQTTTSLPPSVLAGLDRMTMPAVITVFIAAECPHCPGIVNAMLALARECDQIHLKVMDGELFSDVSREFDIRSVPTVILDDHYRWIGIFDIAEMIDMLVRRDPVQLGKTALRQLIEDGKAEDLAVMMSDRNRVFPAFTELLVSDKWTVRLGAMVVFEYLNDRSDILALQVLESLWAGFEGQDDAIKGDILYLVGESGRTEFGERLHGVIRGPYNKPVREAAAEALTAMKISDAGINME